MVDSAARNAAVLSDGCNPQLVAGAEFAGIFEMPIIKKPKKMIRIRQILRFIRIFVEKLKKIKLR